MVVLTEEEFIKAKNRLLENNGSKPTINTPLLQESSIQPQAPYLSGATAVPVLRTTIAKCEIPGCNIEGVAKCELKKQCLNSPYKKGFEFCDGRVLCVQHRTIVYDRKHENPFIQRLILNGSYCPDCIPIRDKIYARAKWDCLKAGVIYLVILLSIVVIASIFV